MGAKIVLRHNSPSALVGDDLRATSVLVAPYLVEFSFLCLSSLLGLSSDWSNIWSSLVEGCGKHPCPCSLGMVLYGLPPFWWDYCYSRFLSLDSWMSMRKSTDLSNCWLVELLILRYISLCDFYLGALGPGLYERKISSIHVARYLFGVSFSWFLLIDWFVDHFGPTSILHQQTQHTLWVLKQCREDKDHTTPIWFP